RHFREHFAGEAVVESSKAVVPGNIQVKDLSRGLLVHLKQESEKLRRGFPLPMIQALCRDFEKEGLRFFKRGKKALHVSSVRPKGINESVSLTAQVQSIIDRIISKPGTKVVDLLVELADDFIKPEKDQAPETLELTDKAKNVLKDLRWLTSEGYVIEFPDTKLALGKQPKPGEPAPKKKAPAKKAAEAKEAMANPEKVDETVAEKPAETEPVAEAPIGKEVEPAEEKAEVAEEAGPEVEVALEAIEKTETVEAESTEAKVEANEEDPSAEEEKPAE
ncbi:MAG: hypothetical protein AAF357_18775, partial [Verrucomicrobiota bacterium]